MQLAQTFDNLSWSHLANSHKIVVDQLGLSDLQKINACRAKITTFKYTKTFGLRYVTATAIDGTLQTEALGNSDI